ncbi:MAG: hypothetical protein OEX21_10540, partial [Betaproteobacteria bacterium]|nr:hypothetical protein [Betaproteobacteria bacterium]
HAVESIRIPGPMPFAYYDRLSPSRQRVYRRSDAIVRVTLPDAPSLVPLARAVEPALATGEPRAAQSACQALVDALNAQLATPPVRTRILARRPSDAGGELHGLYEPDNDGKVARVSVWMRTAARDDVVKFRTFLRTLVHEMCHHFDYELYKLPETFHTEGFYARESALVRDLLGEPEKARADGS